MMPTSLRKVSRKSHYEQELNLCRLFKEKSSLRCIFVIIALLLKVKWIKWSWQSKLDTSLSHFIPSSVQWTWGKMAKKKSGSQIIINRFILSPWLKFLVSLPLQIDVLTVQLESRATFPHGKEMQRECENVWTHILNLWRLYEALCNLCKNNKIGLNLMQLLHNNFTCSTRSKQTPVWSQLGVGVLALFL